MHKWPELAAGFATVPGHSGVDDPPRPMIEDSGGAARGMSKLIDE
jgi:hypothetical protein